MLLGGENRVLRVARLQATMTHCGICRGACYCYDDDREDEMYEIIEAHEDGRHATANAEDIAFWAKAGCPECAKRPAGQMALGL